MKEFIKIHAGDNVVVALKDLKPGTEIVLEDGRKVTAAQEIPAGHKMAISDVEEGGDVIKYGARIGNAKEKILAGQWVHVHNLKTALGDLLEYTYEPVETVKGENAKTTKRRKRKWETRTTMATGQSSKRSPTI